MNELQTFNNEEFGEIRTVSIDGEDWFVGKDVAGALGYKNSRKAIIDHIDEEDKGVTKCNTIRGMQELTIINESGLYSLIFASKLPTARKFKRWVTSEVLPALRERGRYVIEGANGDYMEFEVMSPRERLSLAKLIASAPRDRLPAVKQIVQPLVNEDLDELLPTLLPDPMTIDEEEVIKTAYKLAKSCGITNSRNKNEYILDRDVFNETFSDISGRVARKILENHGYLVRDGVDHPSRSLTCLRYINGKRTRCVVIRKIQEESD